MTICPRCFRRVFHVQNTSGQVFAVDHQGRASCVRQGDALVATPSHLPFQPHGPGKRKRRR